MVFDQNLYKIDWIVELSLLRKHTWNWLQWVPCTSSCASHIKFSAKSIWTKHYRRLSNELTASRSISKLSAWDRFTNECFKNWAESPIKYISSFLMVPFCGNFWIRYSSSFLVHWCQVKFDLFVPWSILTSFFSTFPSRKLCMSWTSML